MLLQKRNHRLSMVCLCVNLHIVCVTLKPMFWSEETSTTVFSVLQSYSNFHMHDHGDNDNDRCVREILTLMYP